MTNRRANIANFLLQRNFATEAVLRFCRYEKIKSIAIEASTPFDVQVFDSAENECFPYFKASANSLVLSDVNRRYCRLYFFFLKNTWEKASTFEQLQSTIRLYSDKGCFAFEKNHFTHFMNYNDKAVAVYDLATTNVPFFLKQTPPIILRR